MAGLSIGALVGSIGSAAASAEADLQAQVNSGDMSAAGLVKTQVAAAQFQTVMGAMSGMVDAFKRVQEGIVQKL
jgi:hypothetical protein